MEEFASHCANHRASSKLLKTAQWKSLWVFFTAKCYLPCFVVVLESLIFCFESCFCPARSKAKDNLEKRSHAAIPCGADVTPTTINLRENETCTKSRLLLYVSFAPLFPKGCWPFSGTGKPPCLWDVLLFLIHCFPPLVMRNGGPQFGACLILSDNRPLQFQRSERRVYEDGLPWASFQPQRFLFLPVSVNPHPPDKDGWPSIKRAQFTNGRVFIQSWRWDPPKLSRKIPSFSQNDFGNFLRGGYPNRSSGIHRWGLDLSTGYPNAYFSWFSGYPQLTLVFRPGDENFQIFFLRCLSRKSGSQHQLRIKTLPSFTPLFNTHFFRASPKKHVPWGVLPHFMAKRQQITDN